MLKHLVIFAVAPGLFFSDFDSGLICPHASAETPSDQATPLFLMSTDSENNSFQVAQRTKKKKKRKKRKRKKRKRSTSTRTVNPAPYGDGYLGLLLGFTSPTSDGASTSFSIAGNGGMNLGKNFLGGVFVNSWGQTTSSFGADVKELVISVGPEVNYFYRGFHGGARAGLIFESRSTTSSGTTSASNSLSEVEFGLGFQVGYDYKFKIPVSAGAEASFLFAPSASPESYGLINFHVVGKYWW